MMILKKIDSTVSEKDVLDLMSLSIEDVTEEFKDKVNAHYQNTCNKLPDIEKGIIYGVFNDKELIAVARLKTFEFSYKCLSIEYISVKKDYQGQGVGKFLMNEMFKTAKETYDAKLVVLATIDEKDFYIKTDMQVLGKIDDIDYNQWFLYKKL